MSLQTVYIIPCPVSSPPSSAVKAALPYCWLGNCQSKVTIAFIRICHFTFLSVVASSVGMHLKWGEILAVLSMTGG